MSTIGQYVHWSWANYVTNGTFKNTTFWRGNTTGDTGPTNFSATLFAQHRQNIRAHAKAQFAYKGNLKQLENEYNNKNKEMSAHLDQLIKAVKTNKGHAVSERESLRALMHLVNKSWTDIQLEDIIRNLKVGSNGLIQYTGQGFGSTSGNGRKAFIPSGQTLYIKPLIKRCEELRRLFHELIQKDLLDPAAIDFNTVITRIETALVLMSEKQKVTQSLIKSGIDNLDTHMTNAHGRLAISQKSVQTYILNPLNELYSVFSSRENINKILTYRMSELLGELVEAKANTLALDSLKNLLDEWVRSGTSGSQLTTKIEYVPEFFSGFKKEALSGIARQEIKIKNEDGTEVIDVTFRDVGTDVQQKTDIAFQGQHISMKSTSLQDVEYQQQFLDVPSIALQNSSLFLYLMGIQSQYPDYGTHYLNILSAHPDAGTVYTSMRKQANRALELYILYSALTGEGQLRKGKMANILAVYETKHSNKKASEPRVKFFSMWDIINKIDQSHGDGAIFVPSIASISFDNTWIGHPGAAQMKNANLRISRILVEARNTQISAAISKAFLNALY